MCFMVGRRVQPGISRLGPLLSCPSAPRHSLVPNQDLPLLCGQLGLTAKPSSLHNHQPGSQKSGPVQHLLPRGPAIGLILLCAPMQIHSKASFPQRHEPSGPDLRSLPGILLPRGIGRLR